MTASLMMIADILVAVLLVATIGSSLTLSRKITRLKSDESDMRKTIAELIFATETAERAIGGLRSTVSECDRSLAERLQTAERYSSDLSSRVEAGESVMERISQIIDASQHLALGERREPRAETAPVPSNGDRMNAAAAAAQALAERAMKRLEEASLQHRQVAA